MKVAARLALAFALASAAAVAQQTPSLELPPLVVLSEAVANPSPVAAFAQPVTLVRFAPRVDVQARGLAEAQGDLAIRGGTFENTGLILGAATLIDPQTGHYLTEIPIPVEMLTLPQVSTGFDNARRGFNASAGSIRFDWSPILSGARAELALGSDGFNRQAVHGAFDKDEPTGANYSSEAAYARSEGNGTVANGDHRFERFAGRIQRRSKHSQSDIFVGYQAKQFGWPYLYTPFSASEFESLQTRLILYNHIQRFEPGRVEFTAYYRQHTDDYEFDRFRPGLLDPFQHETRVWALAATGDFALTRHLSLRSSTQFTFDGIESTNLRSGPFSNPANGNAHRSYAKVSVVPEYQIPLDRAGTLALAAGGTFDWTNRDGEAASPLARLSWTSLSGAWHAYTEFSRATQVPGYTALAAASDSGLFRGNPNLGRERATNYEIGGHWRGHRLAASAALFHRRDRDLVDWTYSLDASSARTANPVDIDTTGAELLLHAEHAWLTASFGYTWLTKDASYRDPAVHASFYALNYARHRFTLALTARPTGFLELRVDGEVRLQAPNPLRDDPAFQATDADLDRTRRPLLVSASLVYFVHGIDGLELTAAVENLVDTRFQEVPHVPGAGRAFSLGLAYGF